MKIYPISTSNYKSQTFKKISNISFEAKNQKENFSALSFLQELSKENICKEYYFQKIVDGKVFYYTELLPNKEAVKKLKELDFLTSEQKREFIDEFCSMTGFPDFKKTKKNIESEISNSIHKLAKEENFKIEFIGYDSNCSVGRNLPIPGSDCDGLFMIIDPKEHKEPWYAGKIRWDFKDFVNQRILSTPANHLPEVLDIQFIEKGLKLAQDAFVACNFSSEDLKRFKTLLDDNSNDFIKSAEFNIKLAQKISNENNNREIYYKTAMLAEIIRDGVICENSFNTKLYTEILNSPLFRYSNLMKQKGLKYSLKNKYIERKKLDFYKLNLEEQFQLIKDILYFSFDKVQNNENKKYFSNVASNKDEMGNIQEMYDLILNSPCI